MARQPIHKFRSDQDLWDRFGAAAAAMGTDRSAVMRALIRWWLREDKAPTRPPTPEDTSDDT